MSRFRSWTAAGAMLALSATGCKSMAPAVVAEAADARVARTAAPIFPTPGSRGWYLYLPEKAPGACLQTTQPLHWRFPGLKLGSWIAFRPQENQPVMRAEGECLRIEAGYVWDGATLGTTTPRLLAPTLVHDALYHALMHRAPFARKEADRAFLALLRQWGCPHACLSYRAVRLGGGLLNAPDDPPTLIIKHPPTRAMRETPPPSPRESGTTNSGGEPCMPGGRERRQPTLHP